MKALNICFLMWLSIASFGQNQDTALVRIEVDSLLSLNKPFILQGNFDAALNVVDAAKTRYLSAFDKNDVLYASILFNKALYYHFQGQFPEAKALYLDTKEIQANTIGKKHPDYAHTLSNLGSLFLQIGELEKAESMLLESKEIRAITLGRQAPEYAATLNNLAGVYMQNLKYRKAEQLFLEVKDIRKKTLGEDHYEYGGVLNNLGVFYYETMNFEKAESLYLASIAIKEKALGQNAPDVAMSKSNLANMLFAIGKYQQAEELLLEVRQIQTATIGKNHPDYSHTLNAMGVLYFRMGDYEKSESMYIESKEIWENTTEAVNPDYANIINNLAGVYYKIGDYERAEKLYLQVKDIRAEIQGTDHPLYGDVISNLGAVYCENGFNEKAEAMYLQAKKIRKNAFEEDNAPYAESVGELGSFYAKMGDLEKAEKMYMEALDIYGKLPERNLSQYFSTLEYLAVLYEKKGRYAEAEKLYVQSKEKRAAVLGKMHPDYAYSLKNLAKFYQLTNNETAAVPLFLEYLDIEKKLFLRAARHLSEDELSIYSERFAQTQDLLYSFAANNPALAGVAYDHTLFYKGFVLDAIQKSRKSANSTEKSRDLYNSLLSYSRLLSSEYAKPITERANLEKLEEEANLLEKELIREVADYGQLSAQITWQNVQAELPADAASIEFIHYNKRYASSTDDVLYAALVLRADAKQPELIPLFSEQELKDFKAQQGKTAHWINSFYTLPLEGQLSLKKIIYEPLEKIIRGIKTIYYAPSGKLHRLNLAAIQVDKTTTLGDRFQFVQFGSTRQLVSKKDMKNSQNSTAALFGAINYEADSSKADSKKIEVDSVVVKGSQSTPQKLEASMADGSSTGAPSRMTEINVLNFFKMDSTLRGGHWKYLQWTEVEIGAIELILEDADIEITVKKGSAASEEAFKRFGAKEVSPKIIHLATHGFFFPDPNTNNLLVTDSEQEPVFKISNHPMIRSGLILAGGNYAWQTGEVISKGREDGILTAYEISQMNLSNTELVVLSACETGLGDIKGNEGVYGLQRAFKIAGAKYLIMSLWQVPDYQTQELMTTFYANWLEDKMEIPQAFQAAQQTLKKRYPEPFSWAGFVLVE